ncbi:hypothetical protein [Thiocapsa bogorovii]|nr:hypothetical protein [Thiocapsa bogorovii]
MQRSPTRALAAAAFALAVAGAADVGGAVQDQAVDMAREQATDTA